MTSPTSGAPASHAVQRPVAAVPGPVDAVPRPVAALAVHRWLMATGVLLTAVALLLLSLLPAVPSGAVALTAWADRGFTLLSWSDELLFFAVLCWGAGARRLVSSREAGSSARINVGMTALATALVALIVVLLAVGRLVYPVFGIDMSADVLALLVSSTYGAVHLAYLGFAVAAVTLSWSTRAGLIGRAVGIVAAVVFVVGSFPWLAPVWCNVGAAVMIAVWGGLLSFAPPRIEDPSELRPSE
jgi:hypothetical protein